MIAAVASFVGWRGLLGLVVGALIGAAVAYGWTRFEVELVESERDRAVDARDKASGQAAEASSALATYEGMAKAAADAQKLKNDAQLRALQKDRDATIEQGQALAKRHAAERADFERRLRVATAPADRPGVCSASPGAAEDADRRIAGWLAFFGERLSEHGDRTTRAARAAAACDAAWESLERHQ